MTVQSATNLFISLKLAGAFSKTDLVEFTIIITSDLYIMKREPFPFVYD